MNPSFLLRLKLLPMIDKDQALGIKTQCRRQLNKVINKIITDLRRSRQEPQIIGVHAGHKGVLIALSLIPL